MAEVEAEVKAGAKARGTARVGVEVTTQAPADHLDDGARARRDHWRQTAPQVKRPRL